MINTIICTAMVTNVYLLYAQFEDIVSKTITKNANIFKAIVLCPVQGQRPIQGHLVPALRPVQGRALPEPGSVQVNSVLFFDMYLSAMIVVSAQPRAT